MYCPKCHKAMDPEMPKCMYCGYLNKQYDYNKDRTIVVDSSNMVMNIIGLLIPIIGLVIYFCNRESKPKMSKSLKNYSIFGIIIYIVISILFLI